MTVPGRAALPELAPTAYAPTLPWHWIAAAWLAVAFPTLLAFNVPPSATFLNQAAALVGWGLWGWMLAGASAPVRWRAVDGGLVALLLAHALLAAAALAAPLWTALPWSLSLSAVGAIAAAAGVALLGASLVRAGRALPVFDAFCIALLLAGVAGAAIGVVQVFVPRWTDGNWIAQISNGRAAGNLRQPNHLSSLLLWSLVAWAWLVERGQLGRRLGLAFALLLLAGVVLSASRTGMIGIGLLCIWGIVDRTLARRTRLLLVAGPIVYALLWSGLAAWAHASAHLFGGDGQLGKGDISSSRFAIWSNTLALIASHPWAGIGWGEFNFVWTLTPFPDRPLAFFDHTHNLPLQFAVELGLPLAAVVLALLGWALWRAFGAARRVAEPADAGMLRAAFVMVLLMVVHSQLEYPLWYAHFLLPTAFAFGLCLGRRASAAAAPATAPPSRALQAGAAALLLGGCLALADYTRVIDIFAPGAHAPPLAVRIERGQHSWLFGHHADYAAVTNAEHVDDPAQAFARVTHYLLDTRLMIAWARALAEAGQLDAARHLVQRLREFHNEQAAEFFAVCDAQAAAQPAPGPASAAVPFQCEAPTRSIDPSAFR